MSRLIAFLVLSCIVSLVSGSLYNKPRLPLALVPYHYDLQILTHLHNAENSSFEGTVRIALRAQDTTDLVVLHCRGLTIDHKKIEVRKMVTDEGIDILRTEVNKTLDYLILKVAQSLNVGNSYSLTLNFARELKIEDTSYHLGYYAKEKDVEEQRENFNKILVRIAFSSYDSGSNLVSHLNWHTVTQFERTHIRRALPSFDEPALRATFNVTLGHHKRYKSLSNMAVLAVRPNSQLKDYVWTVHEVTPPMPTYLLAYSINGFACTETKTNTRKPVTIRTWSRPKDLKYLSYATEISPRLIEFFGELFDASFPLEKIDQLTSPHLAGGMENWGLVTYVDESLILRDLKMQKDTASLISHELAHMWFGDLVTNSWWSDLWLKEGFATYFTVVGVEHLHPEWEYGNIRYFENWKSAINAETSGTIPSICHTVEISSLGHPDLNTSVYQKGAAVIRMMHALLGDAAFYGGLRSFMQQYGYGSAAQDQLWTQLQSASDRLKTLPKDLDIKTIMDSWTLHQGYPVITVNRNEDGKSISLTQQHFLYNENSDHCFWVPITYTTQGEADFNRTDTRAWLKCPQYSTNISIDAAKDQWVILNPKLTGYYRINYDKENWQLISKALNNDLNSIHTLNRAQITSDVLFLLNQYAIDGKLSYELLKYFKFEQAKAPWEAFKYGVHLLNSSSEAAQSIMELYNSLAKERYEFYGGFSNDETKNYEQDDILLMNEIRIIACSERIGDCVDKALKYLNNWQRSSIAHKDMSEDLRPAVICAAKCHGNKQQRALVESWPKNKDHELECLCRN